jgi:hypothetical protein
VPLPVELKWLFWEMDFAALDPTAHADSILARILERGRMADVRWAIDAYGMERIHRFLRDVGHPELSERTIAFWRAVLHAEDETWESPPAWRKSSSESWLD